jgi:radical SAM protein with 4Fe4S-binding SPASM domain
MQKLHKAVETAEKEVNNTITKIEIFRTFKESYSNCQLESCHGEQFLTITHDGYLTACPWYAKSNQQPYFESVQKSSFYKARRRVQHDFNIRKQQREDSLDSCVSCISKDICGKGCPSIVDNTNRDLLCALMNHTFETREPLLDHE